MLDVKFLREELTRIKERMATRETEIDWDEFVYLDQQRRDTLARVEKLKERKNRLSGEIGKVKKSGGDAIAVARGKRGTLHDSFLLRFPRHDGRRRTRCLAQREYH